ncbi:phage tail tape measure protein [Aeromonas sp. FDAARGOS 1408]|uniref:phage tail tape measure protein n=1 Tax=Aeromonas TaxID=642 RepID=UPI001C22C527|nr:phage tail tape measure protein [Aeromonas sp. FDAARGOS 1408]QXC08718.1 phage tail tape measure protein [Aeromonas sp. FDAARGOS 1408]HDX8614916.1 phage tail tape measure protein [Aeromonas dhakensis]
MANEFQLKALITGVDKLSPALKGIRKNIKSWQRDLKSAGEGAPAIGAGLAAAVGGSLAAFAQSENAATGLKVAMMDASGSVGPEFKKMNDLAVGLGNKLPGTTADFQDMMTMLQRQGLSAETVLGGVGEATAYLAVQLGKAPAAAAEFAAKMQDATGTASKDMMSLFDTIQKAFYMGVDDTNMLSFFSKTSSVLKMIDKDGLKASQSLAPLAIMMDQMGMAGESSGNAIRKVLQAGFDSKKINAANRLMSRKGIKLDFTDGKGEFGGLDNLFSQLHKLQSLTSQQRTTIIKQIFGDDAETLQVVNALIDKGRSGYDEIQQKMARQASLQQRVGAQLGTLKNLWDAMTGTAVNGLAAIGGAFQGEAKDTVTWLGDMAAKFSEFAAANPEVIRGVVGVAAGFAALKLVLYACGVAATFFGNALTATPLGLILRGVAMAAGLIIANWGTIGPWFQRTWAGIVGFFSDAWAGIKAVSLDAWELIKSAFFNFSPLGILIKNWDPIVGYFRSLWAQIKPYIEPLMNGAKWASETASSLASGAKGAFGSAVDTVGSWFGGSPLGKHSPLSASSPAAGANSGGGRVAGEMVVRFEDAPQNMRVDEGKASPGWSILPDVGYSRYATKG